MTATFFIVLGGLLTIIFALLGYNEKNPKRKLVYELWVLLALGVVSVRSGVLLFQGWYFQSVMHFKRLPIVAILFVAFLSYAIKIYETLKQMKEKGQRDDYGF